MNKKGFTVVEVVVSFAIMAVVMLVIITFMITYRDKVKNAEIETQLLDYKNVFEKIIYDEIIRGNYLLIDYCNAEESEGFVDGCAYFLKSEAAIQAETTNPSDPASPKDYIGIKELTSRNATLNLSRGLYLYYAGNYYMLPDSDLNSKKVDRLGVTYNDNMCDFSEFTVNKYGEKISALRIRYHHHGLDKSYEMNFVIN